MLSTTLALISYLTCWHMLSYLHNLTVTLPHSNLTSPQCLNFWNDSNVSPRHASALQPWHNLAPSHLPLLLLLSAHPHPPHHLSQTQLLLWSISSLSFSRGNREIHQQSRMLIYNNWLIIALNTATHLWEIVRWFVSSLGTLKYVFWDCGMVYIAKLFEQF